MSALKVSLLLLFRLLLGLPVRRRSSSSSGSGSRCSLVEGRCVRCVRQRGCRAVPVLARSGDVDDDDFDVENHLGEPVPAGALSLPFRRPPGISRLELELEAEAELELDATEAEAETCEAGLMLPDGRNANGGRRKPPPPPRAPKLVA